MAATSLLPAWCPRELQFLVVLFLALDMALSRRVGFQPCVLQRLPTSQADSIASSCDPSERFVELAQLGLIALERCVFGFERDNCNRGVDWIGSLTCDVGG